MTRIVSANDESIKEAAETIKNGGLVAMPTETVYGLAANALDGKAVAKIFDAKGRPQFNPLIIHCASAEEAARYVVMDDRARMVAAKFWPGPLTMILPRAQDCAVSELASAGLKTLAVRVPAHAVAQQLIRRAGVPLAAPSANAAGTVSPTSPAHVAESLGDKVDMILAAGACKVGLESTVLDLSGDVPVVLRPGAVGAEDIETVLGEKVFSEFEAGEKPKSPGQTLKHYAPKIPLRLRAVDVEPGEALLAFGSLKFMSVRGPREVGGWAKDLPATRLKNLSEEGDLHEAAANLFAMLRALDRPEHKGIAVMDIPETGLGVAINDRLKKAAKNF
ncbi:MAG: threonylcarbamoyl-AMP synthase [Alphaproteobacteria bacterium]|nr:threonylcarbamoyl-AMP synthase [Alphaproteobacteria bacterium]